MPTPIQPGTVLAIPNTPTVRHWPRVEHSLLTVSRVTATQAIAVDGRGKEVRIRLKDLYLVGESYTRAVIATDEMQVEHAAQTQELARFYAAVKKTNDLIDHPLHILKLNTAQLEALATAWESIKAMTTTK